MGATTEKTKSEGSTKPKKSQNEDLSRYRSSGDATASDEHRRGSSTEWDQEKEEDLDVNKMVREAKAEFFRGETKPLP